MNRLVVISVDSHITPPPEAVAEYLESAYQPKLQDFYDENEAWLRISENFALSPEMIEVMDPDHALRTGGDVSWDLERRLLEMDREGVAAELLFPATHGAITPFFAYANRPYPPDVRLAGVRAYHRWLADFMSEAHGRMIGVARPGPCLDLPDAISELRWCANRGFRSMALPGTVVDPALSPLYDPYYEPYWDVCDELGIVLSVHASYGKVQGSFLRFIERLREDLGGDATPQKMLETHVSGGHPDSPFAPDLAPQRAFWELMVGGIFDRHPNLKLVFTEVRSDWVPQTLSILDGVFERGGTPLRRRPSEYWETNCMAGASSIKRSEVALRHEIGVNQLMFGRDFPHQEGTWPNTYDWLRDAFAGVAEDEVRQILGENALRCYDLDRDFFVKIAETIGPRVDEVLGDHVVRPELIANFSKRSGYTKSMADVDADSLLALSSKSQTISS